MREFKQVCPLCECRVAFWLNMLEWHINKDVRRGPRNQSQQQHFCSSCFRFRAKVASLPVKKMTFINAVTNPFCSGSQAKWYHTSSLLFCWKNKYAWQRYWTECVLKGSLGGGETWATYERLDALQDEVAGDAAWEVLAELRYEFGVALVLLPQQVKLLLLVTEK